jgi:hypothetical protein
MSTKPTTAPPRPRPSAAPVRLSDAALDRRIRNHLAQQREKLTQLGGGDYKRGCMLAFGGCPVKTGLSPKAVALWRSNAMSVGEA